MRRLRAANLVQLIQKDDALVFDQLDRLFGDNLAIDERFGLLFEQHSAGLAQRYLPLLLLPRHDALEHILKVHVHLFHAEIGEDLYRHGFLLDVQLDYAIFQFAGLKPGFHFVAAALVAFVFLAVFRIPIGRARQKQIEQSFGDALLRLRFDELALLLANHADGDFGEIADHAFDIAAVIADLGVLGGLDFEERSADELRETASNLGFADAGRPDHDDVF